MGGTHQRSGSLGLDGAPAGVLLAVKLFAVEGTAVGCEAAVVAGIGTVLVETADDSARAAAKATAKADTVGFGGIADVIVAKPLELHGSHAHVAIVYEEPHDRLFGLAGPLKTSLGLATNDVVLYLDFRRVL